MADRSNHKVAKSSPNRLPLRITKQLRVITWSPVRQTGITSSSLSMISTLQGRLGQTYRHRQPVIRILWRNQSLITKLWLRPQWEAIITITAYLKANHLLSRPAPPNPKISQSIINQIPVAQQEQWPTTLTMPLRLMQLAPTTFSNKWRAG